jgi:hypothetical protein
LLGDPFRLGDEIPAWQPPAVTRADGPGLRKVVAEIERCTVAAPNAHIGYWVSLMAKTLAMRKGETIDMALKTAGWITACGDLPADLWTEGCTEILKSKTFFPAPAELLAVVGRKWSERKRMLDRARSLLTATGASTQDPAKPFERPAREVILVGVIKSARATGRHADAIRYETELAALQDRPLQDWATAPMQGEIVTLAVDPMRPTLPPASPEMLAANRKAAAKFHREAGRGAYADRLDVPGATTIDYDYAEAA